MEQRKYFIYLYYWSDHSFYIGRTYEGSNRYGNWEKYKDQYVYKRMVRDEPYKTILFESDNPIIIYDLEQTFINKMLWYEGNLNASSESNWFQTFMRTFAVKDIAAEDVIYWARDYSNWLQEQKKDIINQISTDIKKCLNRSFSLI